MKQRDFERFNFPIEVEYEVPSRGNLQGQTEATNISLGGIEFQIKEKLRVGTMLSLRIHFPRRNRITLASGELIWRKEAPFPGKERYAVGVRFIQADPFEFEELLRSVERLLAWQSSAAPSSHLP